MFRTTEVHEGLRKSLREFADAEIKPIAYQLDMGNEFPHEAIHKLGMMGYMGIPYPKEYGGAGLDFLSYIIAVEELSRVDAGSGVIMSSHTSLAAYPLFAHGTEEQKQQYLVPLARGQKLGAFGLTEPNAGSDAGGIETSAVLRGDHYCLNGNKIFISNAPLAETYIILAVTTPDIGTKGISAFIVEKGWDGFTFGESYDKMGIRSSVTAELYFSDVRVPKANLLGKEGEGYAIAMEALAGGRIGIAAQALGIAQGAYDNALEYAKEREQFGRHIGAMQNVAFKIADMATKIRCARMLVYSAAALCDNDESFVMESSMAKVYASDTCMEVVNDATQIFGGASFLKGMEVERAYRDAKITTLYEGTNEVQRGIIAAHLMGPVTKERLAVRKNKKLSETGPRKTIILEGTAQEKVNALRAALVAEGYDFSVGIPMDMPISQADRVVGVGRGIGGKRNLPLIEELAKQSGGAIGSSRPVSETLRLLPLNSYVGISGQKFNGNLYIACGISGATQHLKGIKDATTIVAINSNKNARIFRSCDYGIVGELEEILPLLSKALDTGEPKKPAPPMVKMERVDVEREGKEYQIHVCSGCGYEYNQEIGDPSNDVPEETPFEFLPEEWTCPECNDERHSFIPI